MTLALSAAAPKIITTVTTHRPVLQLARATLNLTPTTAEIAKPMSTIQVGNIIQGISGIATVGSNLLSGIAESKKAKASAKEYELSARQLDNQAQGLLESASMYAHAAAMNKESGELNAREITKQSGTIDPQKQMQIGAINLKRRSEIGSGKTTFAAQGVLLEARDGAAVAMWEQDEAADAVLEKLNVMQHAEDEVYNYLVKAKDAKIQGLYNAAQSMGNASQMAGQAEESFSKAREYRRIAKDLRKAAKTGLMKSIATAAVATVAGIATGGMGFAVAGSVAGGVSSLGMAIPN